MSVSIRDAFKCFPTVIQTPPLWFEPLSNVEKFHCPNWLIACSIGSVKKKYLEEDEGEKEGKCKRIKQKVKTTYDYFIVN